MNPPLDGFECAVESRSNHSFQPREAIQYKLSILLTVSPRSLSSVSNMLAAVVVDAARREASDAEISSSDEWSFSKAFKGGGGGASSSSSCATVDCKPNVVLPISGDDVHRFGFTLRRHFLATLRRFCD